MFLAITTTGGAPEEGWGGGDGGAEGEGLVARQRANVRLRLVRPQADTDWGTYRSLVSSSANRCTSSYSKVARHSGHLISSHSLLVRSLLIDISTQSKHVVGSWSQALVMPAAGKSDTGLVSVQTMHSRSPLRTSGNRRWFVMTTEEVWSATLYLCPNLKRGLGAHLG